MLMLSKVLLYMYSLYLVPTSPTNPPMDKATKVTVKKLHGFMSENPNRGEKACRKTFGGGGGVHIVNSIQF